MNLVNITDAARKLGYTEAVLTMTENVVIDLDKYTLISVGSSAPAGAAYYSCKQWLVWDVLRPFWVSSGTCVFRVPKLTS